MSSVDRPAAFAEEFSEPEVNCFHRAIANGCDYLAPGTGLLLLYLLSSERARGVDPMPTRRQSGLEPAFEAVAPNGLRFVLRRYPDADGMVEALPGGVGNDGVLVFPSGSVGFDFLFRREEDVAHYALATGPADNGNGFVLRESTISMAQRQGGIAEVSLAAAEVEQAIRAYPRTIGATIDSWGDHWTLRIETGTGADEPAAPEALMAVLLRHFLDSMADHASNASIGFDVAQIRAFDETFESLGEITDAMCRAYLREANFAAVHMRATAIAVEALSPDLAAAAQNATQAFAQAAAQARSKYIIRTMITRSATADDLPGRLDVLWQAYWRDMQPLVETALAAAGNPRFAG